MLKQSPEPDLSNLDDLAMAEELAICVNYFDEREKTLIQSSQGSDKLMERIARCKAACRATSRWLRSWNAAGCGKDAEKQDSRPQAGDAFAPQSEDLFEKPLAESKIDDSITSEVVH